MTRDRQAEVPHPCPAADGNRGSRERPPQVTGPRIRVLADSPHYRRCMGVNNRQRRAAKAKRRAQDRTRGFGAGGWHGPGCRCGERADEPRFTQRERVAVLIELAAEAARSGSADDVARAVERLATTDVALVDEE